MSKRNNQTKADVRKDVNKQGGINTTRKSSRKSRNSCNTTQKQASNRVEGDNGKHSNDVAWYSKNPSLVKAAGSIPFASVLGAKLGFAGSSTSNPSYVPGIMKISLTPAIGGNLDGDAINQCAASMYSFLVHANSRNYVYTQTDLMLIVLSGASVFAEIARAIRAYGICKYYKEQNLYAPKTIIKACGFEPDAFIRDLGRIWFDLNQLISQTSQIWIPNTMPLIQRWFWLNSNVFIDADDVKGQMYLFDLDMSYNYKETFTTEGGALVYMTHDDVETWDSWLTRVQSQIDDLIASEDRGIMFGDILNAYGKENIYAIPQIPVDYRIEPVYNPEVLSQIENCTIGTSEKTGAFFQKSDNRIYSAYVSLPVTSSDYTCVPVTPVLNMHTKDQPTPEAIMVATRLMASGVVNAKSQPRLQYDSNSNPTGILYNDGPIVSTCGSERVTHIWMYLDPTHVPTMLKQYIQYPTSSDTTWIKTMAFDWHPFLYNVKKLATDWVDGADVVNAYGDYQNYTLVDPNTLSKLHTTALMSLFGVPQM